MLLYAPLQVRPNTRSIGMLCCAKKQSSSASRTFYGYILVWTSKASITHWPASWRKFWRLQICCADWQGGWPYVLYAGISGGHRFSDPLLSPLRNKNPRRFLEKLWNLLTYQIERYAMDDSISFPAEAAQKLLSLICYTVNVRCTY